MGEESEEAGAAYRSPTTTNRNVDRKMDRIDMECPRRLDWADHNRLGPMASLALPREGGPGCYDCLDGFMDMFGFGHDLLDVAIAKGAVERYGMVGW